MFLFQVLAVRVLEIKNVAFQLLTHMAVMENGPVSTHLIKVQILVPYFVLLMLEGIQTKLIVILKTFKEKLLINSLSLIL